MFKLKNIAVNTILTMTVFACEQGNEIKTDVAVDDSPLFMELPISVNARIPTTRYAVMSAEYLTAAESGQVGRTVFFSNVGNKQLTADFVPGLSLDETDNVSYYIDENRPSADLPVAVTSAAISRAMNTWDGVSCSDL